MAKTIELTLSEEYLRLIQKELKEAKKKKKKIGIKIERNKATYYNLCISAECLQNTHIQQNNMDSICL